MLWCSGWVLAYHDEACEFGTLGRLSFFYRNMKNIWQKCKIFSDHLIRVQYYGRTTLKSEWYTKIFGAAYSYQSDNRTFQDYARHFSENVVHLEDNFQPIKNKFHRVIPYSHWEFNWSLRSLTLNQVIFWFRKTKLTQNKFSKCAIT